MSARFLIAFILPALMLTSLTLGACGTPAPASVTTPATLPVAPKPPAPVATPTPSPTSIPPSSTPIPAPSPASTPVTPQLPASSVPGIDGVISAAEYPANKQFRDYSLSWRTEGANIFFGIRAKTVGWVALGFGGGMDGADLIMMTVKNGQPVVTDQFALGYSHQEDTTLGGTNDITVFAGTEKDGFTSFEFRRALNTGDKKYDSVLVKGKNFIVWSYGDSDDLNRQHLNRGTGDIIIE